MSGGIMALIAYGAQDVYLDNTNIIDNSENFDNIIAIREIKNDTMCPVTFSDIEKDDMYTFCSRCNYNFSQAVFKWIREHRSCPMCRNTWNTVTIYKQT